MKKTLTILMLVPFVSFACEKSCCPKVCELPADFFSLNINASPAYSSAFFENEIEDENNLLINESIEPLAGYKLGLDLQFKIQKHVSIKKGLYFTDVRFRHIINTQNAPSGSDASPATTSFDNRYMFLELPLMVQVEKQLCEKFTVQFSIGGSASKLIMKEEDGAIFHSQDVWKMKSWLKSNKEDFFIKGHIAGGISWKMTPKTALTVEPIFDINLKEFEIGNNEFDIHPFMVGLRTGLTFAPWGK